MICLMGYLHAAMKTKKTSVTIGIDLGDRKHAIGGPKPRSGVIHHEAIHNTRLSSAPLSRRCPKALRVMEVATDPGGKTPVRRRWSYLPTPRARAFASGHSLDSNSRHDSC